jgi:hypothetical protein
MNEVYGNATCTREIKMYTKFWSKELKVEYYAEDLGKDGRVALKNFLGYG